MSKAMETYVHDGPTTYREIRDVETHALLASVMFFENKEHGPDMWGWSVLFWEPTGNGSEKIIGESYSLNPWHVGAKRLPAMAEQVTMADATSRIRSGRA